MGEPGSDTRVVAVTVTYRRPQLLGSLIEAVHTQTRRPDAYLVVDNGGDAEVPSTLGPWLEVLRPGANVGPAGGYALGFEEALARGADRVWVLDDDTLPDPGCLERELASSAEIVLPRQRRTEGSQEWLPWVGGLFDAEAVRLAGPPRAELFIWAEDYEFARRLRNAGAREDRLPDHTITHVNPMKHRRGEPRTWRVYYEVRNSLYYRLRVKRPTVRVRARAALSVAKTAAAILVLEPHKRRSLRLLRRAVGDFRAGRFGKRVDPETWQQDG